MNQAPQTAFASALENAQAVQAVQLSAMDLDEVVTLTPQAQQAPISASELAVMMQSAAAGGSDSTVSETVDLPSNIVPPEGDSKIWRIEVFASACFNCLSLAPNNPEAIDYEGCHFSEGNSLCPAQGTTMIVVGKVRRFTTKFEEARQRGDRAAVAKMLAKLSSFSAEEQAEILTQIGLG